LTERTKKAKENVPLNKPGPAPIIPMEIEDDLQSWVLAMQSKGFPVSREMIHIKGNEVYRELYGGTRSIGRLSSGWVNRFMQRHPLLTLRSSQVIKRVRADATEEGLREFFNQLTQIIIEFGVTRERIFNMDETGFAQKSKSKKVIAVKGSKNVWSKSVEASFHLTITACVSASGYVLPPMFIVPGQRLNRDVMDGCDIPQSVVSVAPKGFMNSKSFLKWIVHFENNVPGTIKRPLVLVYDGYGSHYNDEIVEKAIEIGVILLLLPANATHLIQPLDISVFKPFKTVLKREMESFMIDNAVTTFTKKQALQIASIAWTSGIIEKPTNIINGFEASGIYPPSFPLMQKRWRLYHDGGVDSSKSSIAPWIKCREIVRTEVLNLPPPIDRTRKRRKTLDMENRVLTREQLNSYRS